VLHRPEPRPRLPREAPRIAGLVAVDDAAHRLLRRLLDATDAELAAVDGVASPRTVGLLGPADALPWVDGVVYVRRSVEPGLLLPTTEDVDVPVGALLSALLSRHRGLTPPVAMLPSHGLVVPLAGARPPSRTILRAWMEARR